VSSKLDKDKINELCKLFNGSVMFDEPMKNHTSFKIGGPADILVEPNDIDSLKAILKFAKENCIPLCYIGSGSNLLVRDSGIRGIVVKIAKGLDQLVTDDTHVSAGAGIYLPKLVREVASKGLSGLEFACGIPGSLGGALCMNAGAYGFEIGSMVENCCILDTDTGKSYTLGREELCFSYRHSIFMEKRWICLSARLRLVEDSVDAIRNRMQNYTRTRREKQPLEHPSAGSYFKRPEGYFAGALIDECGLKGLTVGNAVVSEKHAGFIVNLGGATSAEVLELEERICRAVQWKFGIRLEREVRFFPDKEDYGCHLQQK